MKTKAITMGTVTKLPVDFYRQPNVLVIAKALIGKILITRIDGKLTTGRIVETEAYRGETDRASHAWNGRRTNRTEVMYAAGGGWPMYTSVTVYTIFSIL